LKKSIKVYTNDQKNEKIVLHLSGNVKKFVEIKPSKVFLKGNVGESLSQTVSITPGEDEALKIVKVNALKGVDYKYSLKEIDNEGKIAYELTVENTRERPGRYYDKILLVTDRMDQAPLNVIVSGYLTNPPPSEVEKSETDQKDAAAVPENKPEPEGE